MSEKQKEKSPRIVIYVHGGVVQDVLSDTDGIEMMLVDYDSEECGVMEQAERSFAEVPVDCDYIGKTIQGVED